MRLLDTITFELRTDRPEVFAKEGYAILSHRWRGAEVTFAEIGKHAANLKDMGQRRMASPQLEKIRGACQIAREQGFKWLWIDNVCINKFSATEETESINSMFRWYRDARICITYLSDVRLDALSDRPGGDDIQKDQGLVMESPPSAVGSTRTDVFQSLAKDRPSEWFSRGWTLQELLAPKHMYFYDMDWNYIGAKSSLARNIQEITGIDADYITGVQDFRDACVAAKFSWMTGRTTEREEDMAYSMLGFFNITMAPIYGEGQRAFLRLQKELLSTTQTTDESMFAWRMPDPGARGAYSLEESTETTWNSDEWGLLAPSPTWFHGCGNVTIKGGAVIERPLYAFKADRYGVMAPLMYLKEHKKYQKTMLLSVLFGAVIGAIPVLVHYSRKIDKQLMDGWQIPLNCWVKEEDGELAAVVVWLSVLPETIRGRDGNQGPYPPYKAKRIRCTELLQTRTYTKTGSTRETMVLQPGLCFNEQPSSGIDQRQ
ncbi:hypothetical protein OPT61_g8209 [Boeremia exigua]|uniref:Uncharacterized protein n=1 Tax=Boeremia exigua TaxID=749465 RepID=A0ACC2I022_9PLEO|nr:hypothetical protein OPT61_g8209 [Boeremia exigua]